MFAIYRAGNWATVAAFVLLMAAFIGTFAAFVVSIAGLIAGAIFAVFAVVIALALRRHLKRQAVHFAAVHQIALEEANYGARNIVLIVVFPFLGKVPMEALGPKAYFDSAVSVGLAALAIYVLAVALQVVGFCLTFWGECRIVHKILEEAHTDASHKIQRN